MKTVWVDGSSDPNPGEGGWAVVGYNDDGSPISIAGYEPVSTNNTMELTAFIKALELVTDEELTVHIDSDYVRLGVTEWMKNWKKNNWSHKVKHEGWQPVKNAGLWQHIDALLSTRMVTLLRVKGHSKDPHNDKVHDLANYVRVNKGKTGA